MMDIWISGGGWISAEGYGRMSQGRPARPRGSFLSLPSPHAIFSRRLPHWGRYDDYTKCGLIGAALALQDAGLAHSGEKRPIGIVCSSTRDCFATDVAYYETAAAQGGSLASPSLFSYTLPGAMLGECAIHFRLTGPTLCVGEEGGWGMAALRTAMLMLAGGEAPLILAGWTDGPAPPLELENVMQVQSNPAAGAAFVVLALEAPQETSGSRKWPGQDARATFIRNGQTSADLRIYRGAGRPVESILDLFNG